ncbi:MAG: MFS transporter [Candidatus Thermoplasmatota archaeon]|nr:MFS transporter [Candidatus Thermoplasmatota archaeon]
MEQAEGGAVRAKRRRILAGISTNVLVLGIVSFLTDMSSEMIYPIMPYFLVAIGSSALLIGLIEGAAETTASLLKVFSGWYSDRYRRRKPFILSGYSASALAKPLFYLATSPWHVLGVRVAERVGKGVRSAPRDALIADSSEEGMRGKAYGLHKALDSAGAVIGPLLVLPILLAAAAVTEDTYREVFLWSTIPAVAAVAVIILFVKEVEATATRARTGRFFREIRALDKSFRRLMLIIVTFYIGEINVAFLILKASDAGIESAITIILYVIFNIVFFMISMPAGTLSDRVGRRPIIATSFALLAVTCAVMAYAETVYALLFGFVIYGAYKGSSEGVLKAYVTDFVPKHTRGTALGAFHTCAGLVMLPGSVIAGFLWDSVGPWATFAYGIAMSLAALVMLIAIGPGRERRVG